MQFSQKLGEFVKSPSRFCNQLEKLTGGSVSVKESNKDQQESTSSIGHDRNQQGKKRDQQDLCRG